MQHGSTETVRLDRWLWAARFFKTRPLAADAVKGGKVTVNGARSKPAKSIKIGDQLSIQRDPDRWVVTVAGLTEKRVSAPLAQALYDESEESRARREALGAQLRAQAQSYRAPRSKPSKRERRTLEKLRRGAFD